MSFSVERFENSSPEWDAFVMNHPCATSYHRFAWKDVIEKSFGHSAWYLGARDDGNRIRGILPLIGMQSRLFGTFIVSLPFVNYGGLLLDDEKAGECLLEAAGRLCDDFGARSIELRHLTGDGGYGLPAKTHKVTMILDLHHEEKVQWQSFNAKLRNQIRKAEKSGLTFSVGGLELLDGFYEVFCRNMRDLGTPVYGKRFFRNVLEAFPDSARILSVFQGRRTVASGILCLFREVLEVPWASSLREYRSACPNNMLYWEAIRFAIASGCTRFDFGRSTPHEGTYRFKEQWGAKPVQLYWHYLLRNNAHMPELNTKNPRFEMAIRIWQKLPVQLTKAIGPMIVRSIP